MGAFLYEYEIGKAADVLVHELFKVKEGESFVITDYKAFFVSCRVARRGDAVQ